VRRVRRVRGSGGGRPPRDAVPEAQARYVAAEYAPPVPPLGETLGQQLELLRQARDARAKAGLALARERSGHACAAARRERRATATRARPGSKEPRRQS